MRPAIEQTLNLASALFHASARRMRGRSRQVVLGLLILTPIAIYYILRHLIWSGMGRWYWNYLVSFHPAMAFIIPKGDWGPVENRPRPVPTILEAPWMGDWPLPILTPPTYHHPTHPHKDHSSLHLGILSSPAIVKIHIFSIPSEKAASKRRLIRRISPLLSIPPGYRHLIEVKFLMGYFLKDGQPDPEAERVLEEEQREFGDLIRLPGLYNGENLREGKILNWMRAIGLHEDGGREAWWLFKMDDDTVIKLPNFLDDLLSMNPQEPTYVGTSLNRWPAYHYHFTGMLTGYSHGVSLATGIKGMNQHDLEFPWDDDVLMGELMYTLPPAPHCRPAPPGHPPKHLPAYCDFNVLPPWGWETTPPSPHPRTGLVHHDYVRHAGDHSLWWIKGDIARHAFKDEEGYEREWRERVEGKMWVPPSWMDGLRDPDVR